MAITIIDATPKQYGNTKVFDVIATSNEDEHAIIRNPFRTKQLEIYLIVLEPMAYLSMWMVEKITTKRILLIKEPANGTRSRKPQVRVIIKRPISFENVR